MDLIWNTGLPVSIPLFLAFAFLWWRYGAPWK